MATGNPEQLTLSQVVRLARVISCDAMESIALGYLGIEEETIKNLKFENQGKAEAFNRSLLRQWIFKNPRNAQSQVSSY